MKEYGVRVIESRTEEQLPFISVRQTLHWHFRHSEDYFKDYAIWV